MLQCWPWVSCTAGVQSGHDTCELYVIENTFSIKEYFNINFYINYYCNVSYYIYVVEKQFVPHQLRLRNKKSAVWCSYDLHHWLHFSLSIIVILIFRSVYQYTLACPIRGTISQRHLNGHIIFITEEHWSHIVVIISRLLHVYQSARFWSMSV